ncbi:MAG: EpsG family protein, partial [Acutalibacteraceae bacterium]
MIIHLLLFFVTVLFAKFVEKTGTSVKTVSGDETIEENRAALWAALFAYFPTIFIIGFRSNLGDSKNYISSFSSLDVSGGLTDGLSERNPGFDLLMRVFKKFVSDRTEFWMLFLAFISFLFLLAALSRYSPSLFLSTFILFGSTEISYSFNGARQFLAICMMIYALKYIEQKKIVKYILLCIAAYTVHQTALVIIPAYFVVRGKVFNKKMMIVLFATLAATLFSSTFIEYLNDWFIEESVYAHYYDSIVSDEGINIFRVLVAVVPMILCIVYKKRIDDREKLCYTLY